MVIFEAARAICNLKDVTTRELTPAVTLLQLFLSSNKPVVRFAAVRTLNKVSAACCSRVTLDFHQQPPTALKGLACCSMHPARHQMLWWYLVSRAAAAAGRFAAVSSQTVEVCSLRAGVKHAEPAPSWAVPAACDVTAASWHRQGAGASVTVHAQSS